MTDKWQSGRWNISMVLGRKRRAVFLAVGFIKPYSPYVAPKKYFDLYERSEIELAEHQEWPRGAPTMAEHGSGEKRRYTNQPKKGGFSEANQRETKHAYYACISYIDAQIGRVMEALERNGLAENTLVVLWIDHGSTINQPIAIGVGWVFASSL